MRILIGALAIALMTVAAHAQDMAGEEEKDTNKTRKKPKIRQKPKPTSRHTKKRSNAYPYPTKSPILGKACDRPPPSAPNSAKKIDNALPVAQGIADAPPTSKHEAANRGGLCQRILSAHLHLRASWPTADIVRQF